MASFLLFLFRKLGQDHSPEYQRAAKKLFWRKHLAKDQPAKKRGKYRFQAEQQRSYRRICIFLSDHLEGIGHAAGHNASVKDRQPGRRDVLDPGSIKGKSQDPRDRSRCKKLDTGKEDSVRLRRKMIHHKNMHRKGQRTKEDQKFTESY